MTLCHGWLCTRAASLHFSVDTNDPVPLVALYLLAVNRAYAIPLEDQLRLAQCSDQVRVTGVMSPVPGEKDVRLPTSTSGSVS